MWRVSTEQQLAASWLGFAQQLSLLQTDCLDGKLTLARLTRIGKCDLFKQVNVLSSSFEKTVS